MHASKLRDEPPGHCLTFRITRPRWRSPAVTARQMLSERRECSIDLRVTSPEWSGGVHSCRRVDTVMSKHARVVVEHLCEREPPYAAEWVTVSQHLVSGHRRIVDAAERTQAAHKCIVPLFGAQQHPGNLRWRSGLVVCISSPMINWPLRWPALSANRPLATSLQGERTMRLSTSLLFEEG